jgi:hypothetical protein
MHYELFCTFAKEIHFIMKRSLFPILICLLALQVSAQQVAINKQHSFPKTVPPGNYSGITWLGGDRYAVVNDKARTAGFHLMTIRIDETTGDIKEVRADSFVTSNQPNRDEEGICYVPQRNTLFVSGETDRSIVEYQLDGQLTGKQLTIPTVFKSARGNGGFEALTYNATTHRFWTTTENTLKTDGVKPNISRKIPNVLRFQSFADDLQPREQYWYMTDSSEVKGTEGKSTLGVSALAALDDGQLIVLEREVYQSPKNVGSFVHVKLYVVNPTLQKAGDLLQKQLITDFTTKMNVTDRSFANYEGLCVGPKLKDGRLLLMLVADSQDQYKGYLKDWFRSIAIANIDFKPQPNAGNNLSAVLKAISSAGNDSGLKTPAFLSNDELPNPIRFIPEPPQPGTGPFDNDTYYYHYGKAQRQTPRGNQAALDEVQWTSKAFSEAAGFMIGPDETPEIFKLAQGAQKDANATNKRAKNYFRRTRPYVYFNEPSLVSEADEGNRTTFSYPSGHTIRGWVYALTLALVVPDSTEALIARAQEYAINRVICGRHYKSDIDASLVEATAVMSRLLSNAAFLEQLEKARKEYAHIREKKKEE